MIIPFANTYAIPALDLVPTFYNCLQAIQSEVHDYKNKPFGIKKVQSGGRGRAMLLDFYSLEPHIQNALGGDPKKVGNPLEHFYNTHADAVKYYTTYEDEHGILTLAMQEEYITNASVMIAAHALKHARVKERASKGNHTQKGINATIVKDVTHFNQWLKVNQDVQHTLPDSDKRFLEKFNAFINEDGTYNFKLLISKKRANVNGKIVTDHTLALLNNLFATQRHKPTRTEVARLYDSFLAGYTDVFDVDGVLFEPKDFKPLSYNTITNYLGKWEQRLAAEIYRTGDTQRFIGKNIPYFNLEKPKYAGSLISVDDRQPAFVYNTNRDRVWFYLALDVASNAITTYVYGKSKEGIIREFYQKLIADHWQYGWEMPHGIECESNLNSSYKNSFLRPGAVFEHVRIIPNNARTKIIESRNRSLRYDYDKKEEGWIPRPHAKSEANQLGSQPKQIIPYENIVLNSIKHIETWNNTPHDSDPTISRWQYACERRQPKPNAWNWNAILSSELADIETSSCNTGTVNFRSTQFVLAKNGAIALGDDLINCMRKVESKTFNIHYILGNDKEVIKAHVYIGDAFQCELVKKPKPNRAIAEWTAEDRMKFEQFEKYVKTIEEYQKELASQIEYVNVVENGTRPQLVKTFFAPELQNLRHINNDNIEPTALPNNEPAEDDEDYNTPQTSFAKSTLERF